MMHSQFNSTDGLFVIRLSPEKLDRLIDILKEFYNITENEALEKEATDVSNFLEITKLAINNQNFCAASIRDSQLLDAAQKHGNWAFLQGYEAAKRGIDKDNRGELSKMPEAAERIKQYKALLDILKIAEKKYDIS